MPIAIKVNLISFAIYLCSYWFVCVLRWVALSVHVPQTIEVGKTSRADIFKTYGEPFELVMITAV